MDERKDIMVSVFCITYNHEAFIEDALKGFINQKTNFDYEILIHDDCSKDNTAQIIKEYERKYPHIIKPVYQKENLYSKHIPIIPTQLLPKARGKYIAVCEGDDFWTDPYKLQTQVDVMEQNEQCSICFNQVIITDITGRETGAVLPPIISGVKPGVLEQRALLSLIIYPGPFQYMALQLSGCMFRIKLYKEYILNPPSFKEKFDVGDLPLFLYMGTQGKGYYIAKGMSVYRTENPDSWAGIIGKSKKKQLKHNQIEIDGLNAFNAFSQGSMHEEIRKAVRNREFQQLRIVHNIKAMKMGEMQELYELLPLLPKLKEHTLYVFPFLEVYWEKIRRLYLYKRLKRLMQR